MKNVVISSLSPVGNLDAANSVLGKVVEPRIRWNLGSLVASATSVLAQAAVILLAPTRLTVLAPPASAVTTWMPGLTRIPGVIRFAPKSGSSGRSRPLDVGFYEPDTGVFLPVDNADAYAFTGISGYPSIPADSFVLAEAVGSPQVPSFTLSGLVSKIDAILSEREVPVPYSLVLDQFDGSVYLFLGTLHTAFDASLFLTNLGGLHSVYDLSEPVTGGGDPEVVGPVWG